MNDLISRRALCDFALNQRDKAITPNDIMRFPAVDPVKHGKWIENEFGAYCSECGLYAYRSNKMPWKSDYCPICGARMDGDK